MGWLSVVSLLSTFVESEVVFVGLGYLGVGREHIKAEHIAIANNLDNGAEWETAVWIAEHIP